MMMGKLFNSTFENSLRILLLMDEFGKKQNLDMLYVADFMVSYGATFGFSKADLNGDNPYKFSEFASRREIVRLALKQLVLDGLVYPSDTDTGILYKALSSITYSRSKSGNHIPHRFWGHWHSGGSPSA